jgi:tRNA (guanine-N7-)-methyltransferase
VSVRRAPRLPLEALAPYLVEVLEQAATLAWPAVFGNDNPVEIEVGSGKGLFLLTSGQARPDVNFLGIEIFRKYQLYAATRLAKRGLTNVKVACADARAFLAERVAPGSVQAIHVYFPDPWWKTRHRKRRLFTPAFADSCERALQPGGRLFVVTDVESYYQVITETVAQHPKLPLERPTEGEPRHDLDYLTNFERKYRKEGRPIYRAIYRKVGSA